MKKLVSVALATYNGEKYLREQLDSIYNQTYSSIEVVVSDDNSTDETVAILDEYKIKYGLRYTVNDTNLGFVKNFENALKMCNGEYIALCDQDDIWFPEKIELLLKNINNYSMVCSDAVIIDSAGDLIANSMFKYTNRNFFYEEQFNHLLFINYISGCILLMRREVLEKSLPFPIWISYHDWWLAIIASLQNGIFFINKPLIKYRIHGNNQSNTGFKEYNSIIKKIHEVNNKRKSFFFQKEIIWLEELKKNDLLKDGQVQAVNDRILFYEDINNSVIHFKAAYIAFKYRKYMLSKRNFFSRFIFILLTLIA